jgi:hypothetical protein
VSPLVVSVTKDGQSLLSGLTLDSTIRDINSNEKVEEEEDGLEDNSSFTSTTINKEELTILSSPLWKGGQPKETTNTYKDCNKFLIKESKKTAAQQCIAVKETDRKEGTKKLPPGTFKHIITDIETALQLDPGTIKYETNKSRVYANNPTGIFISIEPLLASLLCELARTGEAQTKFKVIKLADLVCQTNLADKFIQFFQKIKIKKNWQKTIVGKRWYRNFMTRNVNKLNRARYKVMDANRHIYGTNNNF